jgi:hypothetical protein
VHSRHQVNNPEIMGEDFNHEPQLNTDLNTMQIFLYKDILSAWDALQKQTTTVSIEGFSMTGSASSSQFSYILREREGSQKRCFCGWAKTVSLSTHTRQFVTLDLFSIEQFYRMCSL